MSRRKSLPQEPIELLIESLAHDGRGVGRCDGKAVFVPGALPGETISARLRQRKRRFDIAQLETVLTASPDRVPAKCRHFDQCGGCSLQHMDTGAQLRAKQDSLAENLKKIGHVEPETWLEPLQADIWGYRSKARLGVRYVAKKGRVLVGFREQGSSFITDTDSCEILIPALGKHLREIADGLSDFDIKDSIPQIEVAGGDDRLWLIFRVLKEPSDSDKEKMLQLAQDLDCEILLQPGGPETITPLTECAEELHYCLPDFGLQFFFKPQDFTQVNSSLNRKMVSRAVEFLDLKDRDTVLDLFCGLGNFSLPMAMTAGHVIGVEGDEEMVARASRNAERNQRQNVEFHAADLFETMEEESWSQREFNKVLLDPPRSGAEEVSRWLAQKAPETIVYISCNPSTLARDAGILVHSGGYKLEKAGVMDMFPHTSHTEAMAVFRKSS